MGRKYIPCHLPLTFLAKQRGWLSATQSCTSSYGPAQNWSMEFHQVDSGNVICILHPVPLSLILFIQTNNRTATRYFSFGSHCWQTKFQCNPIWYSIRSTLTREWPANRLLINHFNCINPIEARHANFIEFCLFCNGTWPNRSQQ